MSTISPNDLPVIAADTASFFEKEGLLTPPQDNKRKLSTSALSSSSRPSSSKASASSAFTAASIHETANEVVIPETLESKETLAFIGFTEDMAAEIYHRYITKPADQDEGLIDFAVGHVELHPIDDAFTKSDDWNGCLRALGINAQLSGAIMMPEYEDIRFTGFCKFWLLESINSSYYALAELDKQLRALQTRIQTPKDTS